MNYRGLISFTLRCALPAGLGFAVLAQQPAQPPAQDGQAKKAPKQQRPKLLFREAWKQSRPGEQYPVTQAEVSNPNLELKLYGPSGKQLEINGRGDDDNNPLHIWSGGCENTWALAVRDKNGYMDLSGLGRVRWLVNIAGFHLNRPIIKLADGTWLVGDHADGLTAQWTESEFTLSALRWRRLDINQIVEMRDGLWVDHPDLSKVEEFGFTDMMRGSGHGTGGHTDLAWFEIYGKSVPR
jgi:hypothetical protein